MKGISGFLPLSLLVATSFIFAGNAFSNGGPMDSSHILSTGNIAFVKNETIRLVSESIVFTVDQDFVDVDVTYELENDGEAQQVSYGFPVEYAPVYYYTGSDEWMDIEVPYFRIYDDMDRLDVSTFTEPDSFECVVMDYYHLYAYRRWYTTHLLFDEGETSIISVQYRFKTQFEDFSTNKNYSPSLSDRFFRYILNPAGNWGDGVIEDFSYSIDFSSVIVNGGNVITVPSGGTWISDSVFQFTAENFNISEADTIEVLYDISIWKMADYFRNNSIRDESIREVSVSSTLSGQGSADYSKRNMFDRDMATAWVEGVQGDGTGEWIEVELNGYSIDFIGIINGYAKDESAYIENSRIRKLKYEIILDEEGPYYHDYYENIEGTVELPDLSWAEIENNDFSEIVLEVYFGGSLLPVKRIRLEAVEVYPGTMYEDLCITELFISGHTWEEIENW